MHLIIIPAIIVFLRLVLFVIHLFTSGSICVRRIVFADLFYFIFGLVVPWLATGYILDVGLENVRIPARAGAGITMQNLQRNRHYVSQKPGSSLISVI